MKSNKSKLQRESQNDERYAALDARLSAYFGKLPQPLPDFDQRLFDKIRHCSGLQDSLNPTCN